MTIKLNNNQYAIEDEEDDDGDEKEKAISPKFNRLTSIQMIED